ncbi:MAG: Oxygen-independent coproporphyrinogen-III oxidase [Pseudomonadota bacterium]
MSFLTPELLTRFDVAGPRYTSYPTADRFVEAFSQVDYVHIPFCESLCYYCACNKIITKHHEKAEPYLRYLAKEVELYTSSIGIGQSVSQLHLGGGTPTFLSDDELRELMSVLKRSFSFVAGGEYSVEVDPRTVNDERLALLFELGFNRLSFGVQDFSVFKTLTQRCKKQFTAFNRPSRYLPWSPLHARWVLSRSTSI